MSSEDLSHLSRLSMAELKGIYDDKYKLIVEARAKLEHYEAFVIAQAELRERFWFKDIASRGFTYDIRHS